MGGNTRNYKGEPRHSYNCTSAVCSRSIAAPPLETLIDEWVTATLGDEAIESNPVDPDQTAAGIATITERIDELDDARWVTGEIDAATHTRLRAVLTRQLADLTAATTRRQVIIPAADRYAAMTPAEKRAVLPDMIERVTIAAAPPGRRRFDPARVTIQPKLI